MSGSVLFGRDPSVETSVLSRFLEPIRQRTQTELVLAGPITSDAKAMRITQHTGTWPGSRLPNLLVENGHGVGGKALLLSRPVGVSDYFNAKGITHTYDHAIRPEAIDTLTAIPVIVDRKPRALVYVASRARVALGDQWFDSLQPIITSLEYNIRVEDEVARRIRAMRNPTTVREEHADRSTLADIARELAELATQTADEELSAKIRDLGKRASGQPSKPNLNDTPALSPRERDVLCEIARGASNNQAADCLGLKPNTVSSYMKSIMTKLDAKNRVQAILKAQARGYL